MVVLEWLHIYVYPPTGDRTIGYVSAYMYICSADPSLKLEVTVTIQITGKKNYKRDMVPYKVGSEGTRFGGGLGYSKFCAMEDIFREPKTTLYFSGTVVKMIQKRGNKETTTYPAGKQEIMVNADAVTRGDIMAITEKEESMGICYILWLDQ